MSSLHVGFLGLGIMGSGMVRRLLAAKIAVTVFNRTRAKAEPLAGAGAQLAESPAATVRAADVVISMVADDAASRAVWLGSDGALGAVRAGTVLVECSTLTIGWVKELAGLAEARGCELLDAPVTGSKLAAAEGQLNFLVGGAETALERARSAFAAMGRSTTHVGPTGSGAQLKLVNNFMAGVQVAALAEALAWVERSGVDRAKALTLLTEGAPGSPIVKTIAARMAAEDYTPHFHLRLMSKDLRYSVEDARAHGARLRVGEAAQALFADATNSGDGDRDMSAVLRAARRG